MRRQSPRPGGRECPTIFSGEFFADSFVVSPASKVRLDSLFDAAHPGWFTPALARKDVVGCRTCRGADVGARPPERLGCEYGRFGLISPRLRRSAATRSCCQVRPWRRERYVAVEFPTAVDRRPDSTPPAGVECPGCRGTACRGAETSGRTANRDVTVSQTVRPSGSWVVRRIRTGAASPALGSHASRTAVRPPDQFECR